MGNKEMHGNKTMDAQSKIYILDRRGMSGSAIKRNLEGKTSVFWSYPDKKALYLKTIFGITGLMDRLNLMVPIARLLDLFKIGESYVVVFRRL